MSVVFPPVGGASRAGQAPPAERQPPPERKSFAADLAGAASAAEPPPEVRDEVRAAARCAGKLHEIGRQLRFDPDPESGRVQVTVCDLDGNVLRRVPLTEALEISRGARVD